jgi:phosphohistidine phosphatase SixA
MDLSALSRPLHPEATPSSPALAASATLDAHLASAIAELAPAPTKEATMTTTPGTSANAIKDLMEEHVKLMGAIHQAQLETLRASLARQRDTVSNAVGAVAAKIDGQTSDFLAMVGQFSNDLG